MHPLYKDTNFKCLHCNKSFGDHQARTFNCPRKGRGNYKGFDASRTYQPNLDKPEDKVFTL